MNHFDEEWFKEYFRAFKREAPKRFLDYGGYDTGLPNGTAASYESVVAFTKRISRANPTILNAGAGVTSWMLRKRYDNVYCCDPDEDYLTFIKFLCSKNNLSTEGFYVGLTAPSCAYTFYDYGVKERSDGMAHALDLTESFIYFDDTDTRGIFPWREEALRLAKERDLITEDCQDACDQYGRWGIILYKGKEALEG